MLRSVLALAIGTLAALTTSVRGQTFVIDSVTRSPATVSSGESVSVTVRVRNAGPSNGQLRSVSVVAAPVPGPLVALPTKSTFNPPRLLAVNEAINVSVQVKMPVLLNCTTTWSFGFDVTVDAGSSQFTRSFNGADNNVSVSPFCPDLMVPIPLGWTREVVVSNELNATTTAGLLSASLPIYVSCDIRNLGGPTPAGVPYTLQVYRSSDRAVVYTKSDVIPPLAAVSTSSALRNTLVPAGTLLPCEDYEARVIIDPNNVIVESTKGNNQASSAAAFLTTAVTVESQPTDKIACIGGTAVFQVQVDSGGAKVFYRWKRNGTALPISGPGGNPSAQTPTLTITNVAPGDSGVYSCSISNACNSLSSKVASLKICLPDFNCDGFLDFSDFDEFVTSFETGSNRADFNGDGFLTFEDFDAFVTAFERGC